MSVAHSDSDHQLYALGNYKVQGITLGKGNFAKVLLATHKVVGAAVALKIIDTSADIEDYVLKNLHREAKILSRLDHPNIIKLYEATMCNGLYCLSLECALGGDLGEHIRRQLSKRLDEDIAKTLFYQLLSAIGHMHRNGILHRDLKVENILMINAYILKLVDFGLSNFYSPNKVLLTRCGSPEYAAPELFTSDSAYGPAIDMWSAGVILYVMMVGTVPFIYPRKCGAETLEGRRRMLQEKCSRGLVEEHLEAMKHISCEGKDYILKLLEPNQKLRANLEEAESHSWLANDANLLIPEHAVNPSVYKDLHSTVLKRLSTLTMKSVEEVEYRIQRKFDSYYAMYHLMRDSIVKTPSRSETLSRLHLTNKQKEKFPYLAQVQKTYQSKEFVSPSSDTGPRENETINSTPISNKTVQRSPAPANQPIRTPIRTPLHISKRSNIKHTNKLIEKSISPMNNDKGNKAEVIKFEKVTKNSSGLPSHKRNALIKGIYEKQLKQLKQPRERSTENLAKQHGDPQASCLRYSDSLHKTDIADDFRHKIEDVHSLDTNYKKSEQQLESINTKPHVIPENVARIKKDEVVKSKICNITPKPKMMNAARSSKSSPVPIAREKEQPLSRQKTILHSKPREANIQPGRTVSHVAATSSNNRGPVTILKRPTPIVVSKNTVKTTGNRAPKTPTQHQITILKRPIMNIPLGKKSQTSCIPMPPSLLAKKDSRFERNKTVNAPENSYKSLLETGECLSIKTPTTRNRKDTRKENSDSIEIIEMNRPSCSNNGFSHITKDVKYHTESKTSKQKLNIGTPQFSGGVPQRCRIVPPIFTNDCRKEGGPHTCENNDAWSKSKVLQKVSNSSVYGNTPRDGRTYADPGNRQRLYYPDVYRQTCVGPMYSKSRLNSETFHRTNSTISPSCNRKTDATGLDNNQLPNNVDERCNISSSQSYRTRCISPTRCQTRWVYSHTRTPNSTGTDLSYGDARRGTYDRVPPEQTRNRNGGAAEVQCYSCDVKFASDGKRFGGMQQHNRLGDRNVFGVQWKCR